MKFLLLTIALTLAINMLTTQCHAAERQSDISHTQMINLITQQLPGLISDSFTLEFNSNIEPKLISGFTAAIDQYQSEFLNSIYDYLKPVVIALIVLACVQVVLSFIIIILLCTYICVRSRARKNQCIKELTAQVVENV